jgi:hypothetical protein
MRASERDLSFPQRKKPLPTLTAKDLREVFAPKDPRKEQKQQTQILMEIPLQYDVLCIQGVRDWRAKRAITIEQCDVQPIRSKQFAERADFSASQKPYDQFERLDARMNKIEEIADQMEQDFDSLSIERPDKSRIPVQKPLFGYRLPVEVRPEETRSGDVSARTGAFSMPFAGSVPLKDRARHKIGHALGRREDEFLEEERYVVTETREEDRFARTRDFRARTGRIDWDRVNNLMTEDQKDF